MLYDINFLVKYIPSNKMHLNANTRESYKCVRQLIVQITYS